MAYSPNQTQTPFNENHGEYDCHELKPIRTVPASLPSAAASGAAAWVEDNSYDSPDFAATRAHQIADPLTLHGKGAASNVARPPILRRASSRYSRATGLASLDRAFNHFRRLSQPQDQSVEEKERLLAPTGVTTATPPITSVPPSRHRPSGPISQSRPNTALQCHSPVVPEPVQATQSTERATKIEPPTETRGLEEEISSLDPAPLASPASPILKAHQSEVMPSRSSEAENYPITPAAMSIGQLNGEQSRPPGMTENLGVSDGTGADGVRYIPQQLEQGTTMIPTGEIPHERVDYTIAPTTEGAVGMHGRTLVTPEHKRPFAAISRPQNANQPPGSQPGRPVFDMQRQNKLGEPDHSSPTPSSSSSPEGSIPGATLRPPGGTSPSIRNSSRPQSTTSDENRRSRHPSRTSSRVNSRQPGTSGASVGLYDDPFLRTRHGVSSYQVVPVSHVDINPNDILDDDDDGLELNKPKKKTVLGLSVPGTKNSNTSRSTIASGKVPSKGNGASPPMLPVPPPAFTKREQIASSASGTGSDDSVYRRSEIMDKETAARTNPMYSTIMAEQSAWLGEERSSRKRMKLTLCGVFLIIIVGAVVGGVVGGIMVHRNHKNKNDEGASYDKRSLSAAPHVSWKLLQVRDPHDLPAADTQNAHDLGGIFRDLQGREKG